MTDTLEAPVEQATINPQIDTSVPPASSFGERLRGIREENPINDRGDSIKPPQQRQERRQAPKPAPETKAAPVEQEKPADPFSVLEKLKLDGVEEGAVKQEETSPPPPGSSEKAIKTWKQNEEARLGLQRDLEAARKELAEAKAVGTPQEIAAAKAELDDLRKQKEELSNKLAAVDVRESAEYRREVSEPIERIFTELQATAKEFNIPWKSLVDALEAGDRSTRNATLSKVLGEAYKVNPGDADDQIPMDDITKAEVVSAINEFVHRDAHGRKLETEAGAVKEALKAKEAKEQTEKKQQTEAQFKKTADLVFDRMKEAIPQLKDDPDFAKQVREAVSLKDDPPHVRAMKDIFMASAERVLKDHSEQHKKDAGTIASLEARIAQLTGASPEAKIGEAEKDEATRALEDKRPLGERLADLRRGR